MGKVGLRFGGGSKAVASVGDTARWLQQFLTFGLLRGAFRPAEQMCALRALSRQRARLLHVGIH